MSCGFALHMECVGVKGNYTPPVCFPQLDDGRLFFVLYFPFVLSFTSARSHLSLLTGRENNVTNIRDINAGKVQTQRIGCHLLQQLKWWDGGRDFKACVINSHVFFHTVG